MQQKVTDVRDSQKLGTLDDVELDHVPATDSTNQVVAQTCDKNDGDETSVNNQDAPPSALTETGSAPTNILSPGANPDNAVDRPTAEPSSESHSGSSASSTHAVPSLVTNSTEAESEHAASQISQEDLSQMPNTRPSRSESDNLVTRTNDQHEETNPNSGRPLLSADIHQTEHGNLILKSSQWGFEAQHYRCKQWMIFMLAIVVYIWTVYYSYNATINPNPFLKLVQTSTNTKIFLIALFSQTTIITIIWITHEVYNCLRWAGISRTRGTDLTSFLVLSPTTSPVTLLGFLLFRLHCAVYGPDPVRRKRVCQPVTFFVILRLLFYGLTIFLSIVLLLNTSDGLACLQSTLQHSTQIGGVLPTDVAISYFLGQSKTTKQIFASDVMLKLSVENGGTVLPAPKSECINDSRCSSYYLMQVLTGDTYDAMLDYNASEKNVYQLLRTPIWHAIVEPYDSSTFQEQDPICKLYGPVPIQLNICVANVFDSARNESITVIEMSACFGPPGFGIGECTENGPGDWLPGQTFAIRVNKRYADLSYRVSQSGGILLYQVDNVSPNVSPVQMPVDRHFEIYDAIFPGPDTIVTPDWVATVEWRILLQAVKCLQTGTLYQRNKLATMAWQVLIFPDVSGAGTSTSEENVLNASACGVVDQIQLSFHSFFIFSTFCGAMLAVVLCCLVGVTTARIPAIANTFGELGLAMELLCAQSHDNTRKIFSKIEDPNIWSAITSLDDVKIQFGEPTSSSAV